MSGLARLDSKTAKAREERVLRQAAAVLERRMCESKARYVVGGTLQARDYLRAKLGALDREVFVVIFLDVGNRIIAAEELFQGTLTEAAVYPREIAKGALLHNAAAVILAHNHPSGQAEFSDADLSLQRHIAGVLAVFDVKVLDSFVVAGNLITSSADRAALADAKIEEACERAQTEKRRRQSAAAKAAWARRRQKRPGAQ